MLLGAAQNFAFYEMMGINVSPESPESPESPQRSLSAAGDAPVEMLGERWRVAVARRRTDDPEIDRVMMCGSMTMIRSLAARFEACGFAEGSNADPGHYVIERAFVEK